MALATGQDIVLGLAEQYTFATAKTTMSYFMDILEETLKGDNGLLTPRTCAGQHSLQEAINGAHTTTGGFKMLARPNGFMGLCLKGLFGQVTTTDLGGGAYQHVFTAANGSTPLPFTVYVDRENGVFSYTGFCFGKLDIDGTVSDILNLTWDGTAKAPVLVTQQASTFVKPRPFVWYDATITLNGSPSLDIENIKISIDQDQEGIKTHSGERFIRKTINKFFNATASFEMGYDDSVMLKRLWGDAAATTPTKTTLTNVFQIQWVSPEEIASSGEYYTLTVDIPAGILSGDEPATNGADGRIMQPLNVVCKSDGTKSIQVTLINNIASYDSPLS